MIGGLFSFDLILCPILWLVYTGELSIPIFLPCSPHFLCEELANIWYLNVNTILVLHSHYMWKLDHQKLSWSQNYWCSIASVALGSEVGRTYVRQSHSRWNSCQVDDSLKAWSSIVFSNDILYLTLMWLL